jgi:hypothetical protein
MSLLPLAVACPFFPLVAQRAALAGSHPWRCSVKPPLRAKSVGTKVSDAEYAALEARARASNLTLSEWVRHVLLASPPEAGAEANSQVVLAELLALRTILMNLLFSISRGEAVTPEQSVASALASAVNGVSTTPVKLIAVDNDVYLTAVTPGRPATPLSTRSRILPTTPAPFPGLPSPTPPSAATWRVEQPRALTQASWSTATTTATIMGG